MSARSWGGKRKGAGRPPGSSPKSRRRRVAVLLTEAEHAELVRLAKEARITVGGLAYELVARALRRRISKLGGAVYSRRS